MPITARYWRMMTAVVLILISSLDWYALIQHAHHTNAVLSLSRPVQYGMRASATYMCPNHFAALLELGICLCIALLFIPSSGIPLKLLAGYALCLSIPVLILTMSRSGWLAGTLGGGLTLWLVWGHKNRKMYYLFPLIALVAAGLLFGILWMLSPSVQARLSGANPVNPDGAVRIRYMLWKDTLNMISQKPATGFGAGVYRWVYPLFKTHNSQLWARYAHNEILQWAGETGFIGMALAVVAGITSLSAFIRASFLSERARDIGLSAAVTGGTAATLIHAMFDFNMHIFGNMLILALIAGTAYACAADGYSAPLLQRRTWNGKYIAWIAAPLCLTGLCASLSFTLTDLFTRKGQAAADALQRDQATSWFWWATRIQPMNSDAWKAWGHVMKTASFWDIDPTYRQTYGEQALAYYDIAERWNGADAELFYGTSRVYSSLGLTQDAENALRKAVEMEKRNAFYRMQLGILLRKQNRPQAAINVFREGLALDPHNAELQFQLQYSLDRLSGGAGS